MLIKSSKKKFWGPQKYSRGHKKNNYLLLKCYAMLRPVQRRIEAWCTTEKLWYIECKESSKETNMDNNTEKQTACLYNVH